MDRRFNRSGSIENRPSAHKRGYNYKWKKARLEFLKRNKYCVNCSKTGKIVVATVVDHIIPHRGDRGLFWDKSNWQPLCSPCHDSDKQREEKTHGKGCSSKGIPVDPAHPWNTED